MSTEAERIAIGTLFNTEWGTTTPISWPNRDFTPPVSQEWVRFSVVPADAFKIEIGSGNNQTRTVGLVFVQVFVPVGSGDGRAGELASLAIEVFADKDIQVFDPADGVTVVGRVMFRSPTARSIGIEGESIYYQLSVSVPYVRDSVSF